jgi:hypothetical protein
MGSLEERFSLDPLDKRFSLDPIDIRFSLDPLDERFSLDPLDKRFSLDPLDKRFSLDPLDKRFSLDPLDKRFSLDPLDKRFSLDLLDIRFSMAPLVRGAAPLNLGFSPSTPDSRFSIPLDPSSAPGTTCTFRFCSLESAPNVSSEVGGHSDAFRGLGCAAVNGIKQRCIAITETKMKKIFRLHNKNAAKGEAASTGSACFDLLGGKSIKRLNPFE